MGLALLVPEASHRNIHPDNAAVLMYKTPIVFVKIDLAFDQPVCIADPDRNVLRMDYIEYLPG